MQYYHMKTKKGRIKKGDYRTGRGYSGWYTNNDGKRVFLRSKNEFIYAKYLDLNNRHFLMEQAVFEINGNRYKPDFFVYEDETYNKLIEIIEVKNSKTEAEIYKNAYEKYFMSIGIKYLTFYENEKIRRKYIKQEDVDNWIEKCIKEGKYSFLTGKKNPMFGIKHSIDTKRKIGDKTREYMSDPFVKEKHSSSIRLFWKSDRAKDIKEKYRTLRHQEKEKRDKLNPIESRKCLFCKNTFFTRKKSNKMTCSNSCSQKRNWSIGKNVYRGNAKLAYKTKILNYAKYIKCLNESQWDQFVKEAKNKNIIPKHFGMNIKIIKKYFGSFNNFKKVIHG